MSARELYVAFLGPAPLRLQQLAFLTLILESRSVTFDFLRFPEVLPFPQDSIPLDGLLDGLNLRSAMKSRIPPPSALQFSLPPLHFRGGFSTFRCSRSFRFLALFVVDLASASSWSAAVGAAPFFRSCSLSRSGCTAEIFRPFYLRFGCQPPANGGDCLACLFLLSFLCIILNFALSAFLQLSTNLKYGISS